MKIEILLIIHDSEEEKHVHLHVLPPMLSTFTGSPRAGLYHQYRPMAMIGAECIAEEPLSSKAQPRELFVAWTMEFSPV